MKNKLLIIALAAIIAFSMTACRGGDDDDSDDSSGGKYWLISGQTTYPVTDGIVGTYSSSTSYSWIAYRYTNETNYEEEYTTTYSARNNYSNDDNSYNYYSENDSYSEYHYTRNGQTSNSTTDTISRTRSGGSNTEVIVTVSSVASSTTSTYDLASRLTASSTTVSSGVTTGIVYSIEMLSDTGGVKTYKYYPVGSNGYYIYKIQNGKTIEVSYYDANSVLIYTSTYTQPDNADIRAKLPNFTLYSTTYHSSSYSINSSYQTVEVLPNGSWQNNSYLNIRVRTFNDGVLSSQTDYTYFNGNYDGNSGSNSGGNSGSNVISTSDFNYQENSNSITITKYKRKGGNANIPAQINGKPVTRIGVQAFGDCYKLTGVTIPDSVTSIGAGAFSSCWSLTDVTISDRVTRIGESFGDCPSLNITWYYNPSIRMTRPLDRDNEELVSIEESYFFGPSLKTVIIPNGVTGIGDHAFWSSDITSITIPNSVTRIGAWAFNYCGQLTSVTFQGTITEANIDSNAFGETQYDFNYIGDLRDKYLAGGIGTYTRPSGGLGGIWTKQ